MLRIAGKGPHKADIVIVGEAPGYDEEIEGKPIAGLEEKWLSQLLREVGIDPRTVYFTNVCKCRPPEGKIENWLTTKKKVGKKNEWTCLNGFYASPEICAELQELYSEVAAREPKIIIGLGDVALWAFTGEWGITAWRGSELTLACQNLEGIPFVPTFHPQVLRKSWELRTQLQQDFKARVSRRLVSPAAIPAYDFNTAPSLTNVSDFLQEVKLIGEAAVDVETSRGQIVCVGLAVSPTRAMCIPFISEGYGAYWTAQQSKEVLQLLCDCLSRIRVIGQNFNYDADYFKDNFGWDIRVAHDTKIAQNVLFPGTPANLGYLASMYCDYHLYWKEDARDWQNLRDFDSLFIYNCKDCCATYEVAQAQKRQLKADRANLEAQFAERMRYAPYVLRMQQRGMHRCAVQTEKLDNEIEEMLVQRARVVAEAAGKALNLASPLQISKLLYTELGLRKPLKVSGPTSDDALAKVAEWHPERAKLVQAILEWRSLASVRNNFLHAALDPDGLLRSSFLPTGTETFRLTSSKNNFHRGTNLLNISGGGKKHAGMPNFRKVITPLAGYAFFDCDFARADLQVVVWEADDADLKEKMRSDVDLHIENAKDLFGIREVPKQKREQAKTFVHLTNYGGGARTCAIATGTTVHEADMAQRRWFAAHPGIKKWHTRTNAQLAASRTITNRFGYRYVFFGRIDNNALREALAWIPQSTIAIAASHVHMQMENIPGVQVLLQMYDSVMGMYPIVNAEDILPRLKQATKVVIPYDDPLIIPMGIKTSTVSWGDCSEPEKGSWLERVWQDAA